MAKKAAVAVQRASLTPDDEPEQAAIEAGGEGQGEPEQAVAIVESGSWDGPMNPLEDVQKATQKILNDAGVLHVAKVPVDGMAHSLITVPIQRVVPGAGGHLSMKVEVRLTHAQARSLKGVYNALHLAGYRRASGQHVDKLSHAVQWLLDQLGEPAASAVPLTE